LKSPIHPALLCSALSLISCTGQLQDTFRYQQQNETFSTSSEINTKIDMLWVVDNTPSMWPVQKKVRDGIRQFADAYMKPNWDIRVAVISQDTYLAHPSFRGFLNGVGATGSAQRYSRAAGFTSTYLNPNSGANPRRTTPFVNPNWWVGSGIDSSGTVTGGGIKLRQAIPEYGGANLAADVSVSNPSMYARLIPGRHDGPLATLCWTSNNNPFFYGISNCSVRDRQNIYQGPDNCVSGGTGDLDSSVQCVNTLMNNTVRSGKPIISTKPPQGVPADDVWTEQLVRDFMVNLSGGVSGYPLEKYFSSIEQLLTDNEAPSSDSKFFRPEALRVIVIVTDEDDQSTVFPSTQITPDAQYNFSGTCPWKNVDGHVYRLQVCPLSDRMLSVPAFKDRLDDFFRDLDDSDSNDPNYFVVTITPTTGQSLKTLHDDMGENANSYGAVSSDLGTRLFEFADLVGNGSLRLEIGDPDYSSLLDQIGLSLVDKKRRFKLRFRPSQKEDMLVWVKHANGTQNLVNPLDYEIDGFELVITNNTFLLSLSDTDKLIIDYQPGSLNSD
jgi:hypothetical protein